MERDPVCGMKLNNILDAHRSSYKGRMVYFCCPKCKKMFDNEPEKYISGLIYDLNYSQIKPDKCDCSESMLNVRGYRY